MPAPEPESAAVAARDFPIAPSVYDALKFTVFPRFFPDDELRKRIVIKEAYIAILTAALADDNGNILETLLRILQKLASIKLPPASPQVNQAFHILAEIVEDISLHSLLFQLEEFSAPSVFSVLTDLHNILSSNQDMTFMEAVPGVLMAENSKILYEETKTWIENKRAELSSKVDVKEGDLNLELLEEALKYVGIPPEKIGAIIAFYIEESIEDLESFLSDFGLDSGYVMAILSIFHRDAQSEPEVQEDVPQQPPGEEPESDVDEIEIDYTDDHSNVAVIENLAGGCLDTSSH